jgi:mono/diheme cytochrome c family protein
MKACKLLFRTAAAFVAMSVFMSAQAQEDASLGQNLAREVCAECHAVEPGVRHSPNPDATAFQTLADTPGINTMAIKVWLQSPHRNMPMLVLEGPEVDDVSAYILSLRPLSP